MKKQKSKKNIQKKLWKNKGITLVALVVTIVILLILTGITITYIIGDSSIFSKVSEAKLETDIASWREKLELAKGPIIIEGLGTFEHDKYFAAIEQQGIIDNKEMNVVDNEDGTYEVTTRPGYVFEVELIPTKEKPVDAKIEYLGQAGKLPPKIRKIIVTGKTKTSIDIQILARLEGGEVSCYCKKASELMENETEDSLDGYRRIDIDDNLEGNIAGLVAGETYKIKAIIRKNGENIECKSIQEKTLPLITVTDITLDKETVKMVEGEKLQLTAIVAPEEAEDKTVMWSSSNSNVVTVTQKGIITGITTGTTTIKVTAKDGSGVSASCTVTVINIWEKLNRVAKAIANDKSVTSDSIQAVGETEDGETYNIKVGDIFEVKYNGEKTRVRVLGFNHDNLVDKTVYGGINEKAGISFEFYDLLPGVVEKMNVIVNNSTGWGGMSLRTTMNGTENEIDGLGNNLSNKQYIKQVYKPYLLGNKSTTIKNSSDWLWCLSCAEIWNVPRKGSSAVVGNAKGYEGEQYAYYQQKIGNGEPTEMKEITKKTFRSGETGRWCVRSPMYNSSSYFSHIDSYGSLATSGSGNPEYNLSPGFCI